MTDSSTSLSSLGWSEFFSDQLVSNETNLVPMRIDTVHRARLTAISQSGTVKLTIPANMTTADFAVGDWVLVDPSTHLVQRLLTRKALLERRKAGNRPRQLVAANIDTLFIVTSCNADFNAARLERYLALANEAGTNPVIVLTKADTVSNAREYQLQAAPLQRGLTVVVLNARCPDAKTMLFPWCEVGRTVALVGSSGVGKSTLVNTLAGPVQELPQLTGGIREHDAKGRHTTTSRSLHAIAAGGWVIDTPGIRTLDVSHVGYGIDTVFAEITELAPHCRFRDCSHAHEPGCAVQAAMAAGKIDPERLTRWRKLQNETLDNSADQVRPRGTSSMPRRKK
ncbi:ribosome small subunit-dependent GTPase A [Phyllobacterium sp. P5_D12]